MELQVLGIGNAFSAKYYNTSFLVHTKRTYLVDGPPGLFRLLMKRGISRESIDAVLVTHVHGDHVAGLETLLLWRRYHLQQKTPLYTTRPVFEKMKTSFFRSFSESFDSSMSEIIETKPEDYVDWIEISEESATELDEDLAVEMRYNWHPTPTLGLKFMNKYGSIGISGDTCYRPQLLKELHSSGRLSKQQYQKLAGDWLWECDLIYHEADRSGEKSPHTQEKDLLALPAEIVRKIRLVHVPDVFEEKALPIALEGERITVDNKGVRVIQDR